MSQPKKGKSKSKKKKTDPKNPTDTFSLPSRESLEGVISSMTGGRKNRPVDAAQEIMYDAWDATTSERAVALAKKALTVSSIEGLRGRLRSSCPGNGAIPR